MKQFTSMIVVFLVAAAAAHGDPAVTLDGRMYVWEPKHRLDNLTGTFFEHNMARLSAIDWAAGTPGTADNVASIVNHPDDSLGFVRYRNAQLMSNGNVLALACDNNSWNRYSLWEIDTETGNTTRRYEGNTQGLIGYTPCIGIDPDNDSVVYSLSTGWNNYRLLQDTTGDGNYDRSTVVGGAGGCRTRRRSPPRGVA